jgi:serine/threonine-protein kinase RsbW
MLRIRSSPNSICRIESFVKDVAERYNIGQDKYPNILISLTEAVNNAILHGNGQDENKYVNIHLKKITGGVALRVSDEGNGFNPHAVPDPTLPENLECCGGRGVFLIRQLSDKVLFYNNGSTVEMHFNL